MLLCIVLLLCLTIIARNGHSATEVQPIVSLCVSPVAEQFGPSNEWITYHLGIGFDHIYLIDTSHNASIGGYISTDRSISRYAQRMTVTSLPGSSTVAAYNDFISMHSKKAMWTVFLGVDDFFVLHGHSSVKEMLTETGVADQRGALSLGWLVFPNRANASDEAVTTVSIHRRAGWDGRVSTMAFLPDLHRLNGAMEPVLISNELRRDWIDTSDIASVPAVVHHYTKTEEVSSFIDGRLPAMELDGLVEDRSAFVGYYSISEELLVDRELETFAKVQERVQQEGYTIRGFYHTSAWQQYWREVIEEQLLILDGSRPMTGLDGAASLLAASDSLYLNIVGSTEEDYDAISEAVEAMLLDSSHKIHFNFNRTVPRYSFEKGTVEEQRELWELRHHLSEGEVSTINALHAYCRETVAEGKKAFVYYLHNKGSKFVNRPEERLYFAVHYWRDFMNAAVIEFPSICLRALLDGGYSTCGVENEGLYFAGNFWWADCQHVAQLEAIENPFDFAQAESFLHGVTDEESVRRRFGYQCGYAVYNSGLNLYTERVDRNVYRERLLRFVSGDLGPNMVATRVSDTSTCSRLRQRPYREQSDLGDELLGFDQLHGVPYRGCSGAMCYSDCHQEDN